MKLASYLLAGTAALLLSAGSAAAATAVASNDLNVRGGPGTGYPVLGVIPQGESVTASECRDGWCHIDYRGQSGWASEAYLGGAAVSATPSVPSYAYENPDYSADYAYDYGSPFYDDGYYDYGYYGAPFGYGYGGGYGWGGGGGWDHGHGFHHAGGPGMAGTGFHNGGMGFHNGGAPMRQAQAGNFAGGPHIGGGFHGGGMGGGFHGGGGGFHGGGGGFHGGGGGGARR